MKTALLKDILREIIKTLPRFLSITLMISLGVFVYSGLKGAAPLMKTTIDDFTEKTKMADIKVQAPIDLTHKDIEIILSHEGIRAAEWHYSVDLSTARTDLLLQVQSLPENISLPYLVEGNLPQRKDEIIVDEGLRSKGYKIGNILAFKRENDKFRFDSDDSGDALSQYQFRIVGFVYHPEFTHPTVKGETSTGLGSLDGFAFILKNNFLSKHYQFGRILLTSTEGFPSGDNVYKEMTLAFKEDLETMLRYRPKTRIHALKQEAYDKIRENEKKLRDAEDKLKEAQNKLDYAQHQIKEGEKSLNSAKQNLNTETGQSFRKIESARKELENSKLRLEAGKQKFLTEKSEYDKALLNYQAGIAAIESGKAKLAEEENHIRQNQTAVANGLKQVEDGFSALMQAEKQLRSSIAQLGMNPDSIKSKVQTILHTNGQKGIQAFGEIGNRYAEIIKTEVQLKERKNELLLAKEQLENGFSALQLEKNKILNKENELQFVKEMLQDGKRNLDSAKMQLEQGEKEYQKGLSRIVDAHALLNKESNLAFQIIYQAEEDLKKARDKYEEGKEEFQEKKDEAEKEIADGKAKISDAKKMIKALKESHYKIITREDLDNYFLYYDSSKRIELLSKIFPVFFFLIAMLVSLSTMTRMAEEHRGQIGTLKALGYGSWDISKKYFYYGLFASLLGGSIGASTGQTVLSPVVFRAYSSTFILEEPVLQIFWIHNLVSVLIGIGCTAVVAFWVVNRHLKQNAATLMRPKAPSTGNKILLEYIPFIWSRLTFLQKVTARNMFRYKVRMLMTVLGISGCTSLVFLGFALKDSVSTLLPVQYTELTQYDYLVIYDEDFGQASTREFKKYLAESKAIEKQSGLYIENVTWKEMGKSGQNVQVYVPQNPQAFAKLQTLRNPKNYKEIIPIPKEGAVITDKIARLAGVKEGDYFPLKDKNNQKIWIKVASIAENYLGHSLYLSEEYYTKTFNKQPVWNAKAIQYKKESEIPAETLVSELLNHKIVLGVTQTKMVSAEKTLGSLDVVVGIMIFVSSLLAFIVLYNLTNINISERIRELSTIKVLGFFPRELTSYVYRETLFLSFIGIGVGYGFGHALYELILQFIVPDTYQLYPWVFPMTYVVSAVMTLIFSLIVMIFVHFRLKHIDMVQALKSYE